MFGMNRHRISCQIFLSGKIEDFAMISESKAINRVQCELSIP